MVTRAVQLQQVVAGVKYLGLRDREGFKVRRKRRRGIGIVRL